MAHYTEADAARERLIADALGRAWSCDLVAAPEFSRFDFTAERDGEPVGVVEIKSRLNRGPHDHGGLLLLNDDKREALLAAGHGGPAIFAWAFPAVVHWLDVRHLPASARLDHRGRPDFRDARGSRPAWRIPVAETTRVLLSTLTDWEPV